MTVYLWRPAAWLRVAGADATNFLQGQFTNDLRGLSTAPAVYGLWLDQKGHVLADSFVLRAGPEAFWVGSYFSPAAVLRPRLEAYIIADDVTVEDQTAAWAGASLIGAGAESAAGEFDAPLRFAGRRSAEPGVEMVFAADALPAVEARVAARRWPRLSADEMERLRIQSEITSVSRDIGPGDLPNEGGLEADAVSYTKGCYLGQEVMARLKSMGRVRRRLLRVAGAGPVPALPAPLFQGGKKTGELRSAAAEGGGFIGLALLTLLGLDPPAGLSFTPGGPPAVRLAAPDDAQ
ncbi:MAG TPA: folate-binding protein [Opitutaceae bacterium]|nr:folate-binding protein [Opitutaceae bacterium]